MSAEVVQTSESLLAYLHGELSVADRLALDMELERNPTLRGELAKVKALDRWLRATMPALGVEPTSDDALADQTLAAWEREQGEASGGNVRADPRVRSSTRPVWPVFLRRPVFLLTGLAAAAALVLVAAPLLRGPSVGRWSEPVAVPLVYRGDKSPAGMPGFAEKTARLCQEALRTSLGHALALRKVVLPSGTQFVLCLQELSAGAFSVSVQARAHGVVVGEWSGDYSGVQAFLRHASSSGVAMAETLTARARKSE